MFIAVLNGYNAFVVSIQMLEKCNWNKYYYLIDPPTSFSYFGHCTVAYLLIQLLSVNYYTLYDNRMIMIVGVSSVGG